jgi:hypothetical protein
MIALIQLRHCLNLFNLPRWSFAVRLAISLLMMALVLFFVEESAESQFSGTRIPVREHWDKYVMYNSSAQSALSDLRKFALEHNATLPLFSFKSQPQICVGIATSRREGSKFHYLSQTLASLVTRLSKQKDAVYIHVFNADNEPHLHKEVDSIRDLFPVSNVKGKPLISSSTGNFSSVPLQKLQERLRKLQEGLDFVEILYEMRSWKCPNLVLLEDDALAQQDWPQRLNRALSQLRDRKWFVVRLYSIRKYVPMHMPWGVTDFDQGFNTVALLLSEQHIVPMAEAVRTAIHRVIATGIQKHFSAKDEFMAQQLVSLFQIPILGHDPPIFQHVGVFSSVMTRNPEFMEYYMHALNFQSEGQLIFLNPQEFFESSSAKHLR